MNSRLLRMARLAAGLTLREVGDAAALDPSAIAHYETGRFAPSEAAAQRWHKAVHQLLARRAREIGDALGRL